MLTLSSSGHRMSVIMHVLSFVLFATMMSNFRRQVIALDHCIPQDSAVLSLGDSWGFPMHCLCFLCALLSTKTPIDHSCIIVVVLSVFVLCEFWAFAKDSPHRFTPLTTYSAYVNVGSIVYVIVLVLNACSSAAHMSTFVSIFWSPVLVHSHRCSVCLGIRIPCKVTKHVLPPWFIFSFYN